MWLYKLLCLMLIFGFAGCSQIENDERGYIDAHEVDVEVVSKPDKKLVITSHPDEFAEKAENDSFWRNNIVPGMTIFLEEDTEEIRTQICSPLASVPLDDIRSVVSDPYDPPLMGKDDRHQGVDFAFYRRYGRASIAGEQVQAVLGGRVSGIVVDRFPYGNAMIVETPYWFLPAEIQQEVEITETQSIYTLYGHLESIVVQKISNEIDACQAIGIVGKSGNTDVEHLHLEMRIGLSNQVIPSMGNYVPDITAAEKETYVFWRTSGAFLHFNPIQLLDITP